MTKNTLCFWSFIRIIDATLAKISTTSGNLSVS